MAAAPYSPQWVCEGPTDALAALRVLKARVYAEPAPSGSSARVLWSLDHVCSANPAAAEERVTQWLQRATSAGHQSIISHSSFRHQSVIGQASVSHE